MLTFKVTQNKTNFTVHDYRAADCCLLMTELPRASYSSCNGKVPFIITVEAALRVMKVTHPQDHYQLLEEMIEWNKSSYEEQKLQGSIASDFCEISRSSTMPRGAISMTIHRESATDSVYLTLHHDSEHVMMDIQDYHVLKWT